MAFRHFLFVFLSVCFISLSIEPVQGGKLRIHPWFAANCIQRSSRCSPFFVKYSGYKCKSHTAATNQPKSCAKFACSWCAGGKKRMNRFPCSSKSMRSVCKYGMKTQTPNKSRKPKKSYKSHKSHQPNKSRKNRSHRSHRSHKSNKPDKFRKSPKSRNICTWTGKDNNVVIDLGKVPLERGWDRIRRKYWRGIIFNQSPARGISPKGRYGKMCFQVKAPMDGTYYFTAISYAPHPTEHNDVWVQSSKGFQLWKGGIKQRNASPSEWLKAYQNNGKKGMSEQFNNIDHNGHRLLVPKVKAGQTFKVCISGRSKKYELYKLILYKCTGMYCKGAIMKGPMLFNLKASRCI